LPANAATGADLQAFAVANILPEVLKAKASADRISSTFNVTWNEPLVNESVESDYGDVLLCRAALDGILSVLYAQAAYDLNSDLDEKANNNQTVQEFLAANPSFGTIKSGAASNLSESKTYATSALVNLRSAVNAMQSETDDQTNDYVTLADLTPAEIDQTKADIADALNSLNGPTFVHDNEIPYEDKGYTLNLSPFFGGTIGSLRALLPSFSGNNVAGGFPDPTMAGVFGAGPRFNLADTTLDSNGFVIPTILSDSWGGTLSFTGWPYK
jgi:hypothetical protein